MPTAEDAPGQSSSSQRRARAVWTNQKGIQGSKATPDVDSSKSFHTDFGAMVCKSSPAPENLPGSQAVSSKEEVRIETNK